MRHVMLLATLSLAVLSSTAAVALAAAPIRATGIVLSVAADKHALRIVEGPRVVDASYRAALPAGIVPGARISFSTVGARAFHLVVTGHVDHVLVSGIVVRDGKLLALRLGDGSLLVLAKGRHLKVGTFAHVGVSFTPVRGGTPTTPSTGTPTAPASDCAKAACTFEVTGSVTAIDDSSGALTVTPIGGGAALTADPGTLDIGSVFVGDFVHLTGTQSSTTGAYTVTTLDELPGCDTADCTVAFDATVDDIESTSLSVADDQGDEYVMDATAAQLSTLSLGDEVHIVAIQDPTTAGYRVSTITVITTN